MDLDSHFIEIKNTEISFISQLSEKNKNTVNRQAP